MGAPPDKARVDDLPRELNTFVGRENELDELTRWLAEAPLVTIAGPGGAGKTRLALHLAHQQVDSGTFRDGAGLVELASLTDPRQVTRAIADALGISEMSGQRLTLGAANALTATVAREAPAASLEIASATPTTQDPPTILCEDPHLTCIPER